MVGGRISCEANPEASVSGSLSHLKSSEREKRRGGVNKRGERVAIGRGMQGGWGGLLSSALKRPMNGGER